MRKKLLALATALLQIVLSLGLAPAAQAASSPSSYYYGLVFSVDGVFINAFRGVRTQQRNAIHGQVDTNLLLDLAKGVDPGFSRTEVSPHADVELSGREIFAL